MGYKKVVKKFKEYIGESFSQSIQKDGGAVWNTNEQAVFTLYDAAGTTGITGTLVKSADNLSLGFMLSKTSTAGLTPGPHKVIVDLEDSIDTEMSDVIAEYSIEYSARTA